MEGKKGNVFKKVSERFKVLEDSQKRLIVVVSVILILLIAITIITSITFAGLVGSAGKVAGNLNNKGFAVAKGNKVYLSNSGIKDEKESKSALYEVTEDNKTKIIEESEWIKSINYYKGYLYFLSMNVNDNGSGEYQRRIVKMKPNGEKREVLVDNIETISIENASLNVSDGWVYYLNSDKKLEKVKTNGEKRQQISEETIKRFQISGKYIYYTSEDDEFGKMKKDGSSKEKIESGIDMFQVVDNELYYISAANKHLMKLDLSTKDNHKDVEVISKAISTFNIYEKTIYYAVNEVDENGNQTEQAIYKIKTNGKKNEKIVDLSSSVNTSICIAGDWIYYTDKVEDSPYYFATYRVKTNGENQARVNI
ncbi:MAG: DUF5050 domain-containing protein [Clostridia bacterium]|jgi:hypothetical protein|nr:DUF5050 domain-containing protein [Clostridia bacterium]